MREFMHMMPPGFRRPTDNKLGWLVAKGRAAENFRCSLLGNGFHIGIVAWLWCQMLRTHGLIECQVTVAQIGLLLVSKHHRDMLPIFEQKVWH